MIDRWIAILHSRDAAGLDDLIADDAVFVSPVVFTPQEGKKLTVMYLAAAMEVFGSDEFTYTEKWFGENSAVLEFATVVDGSTVNGVDIIHWNDDGKISEFKVMLRPIKGVQAVIPRMAALLQT